MMYSRCVDDNKLNISVRYRKHCLCFCHILEKCIFATSQINSLIEKFDFP
ncbi:hypothetical protein HMPREF9529_00097 [Staphylococcus aureus subsp. aureus MRSA177]|nr:hypothetical protein HMPREF9529_00097 [Staphylococcus aureus subsp. aureus MRSA177]